MIDKYDEIFSLSSQIAGTLSVRAKKEPKALVILKEQLVSQSRLYQLQIGILLRPKQRMTHNWIQLWPSTYIVNVYVLIEGQVSEPFIDV